MKSFFILEKITMARSNTFKTLKKKKIKERKEAKSDEKEQEIEENNIELSWISTSLPKQKETITHWTYEWDEFSEANHDLDWSSTFDVDLDLSDDTNDKKISFDSINETNDDEESLDFEDSDFNFDEDISDTEKDNDTTSDNKNEDTNENEDTDEDIIWLDDEFEWWFSEEWNDWTTMSDDFNEEDDVDVDVDDVDFDDNVEENNASDTISNEENNNEDNNDNNEDSENDDNKNSENDNLDFDDSDIDFDGVDEIESDNIDSKDDEWQEDEDNNTNEEVEEINEEVNETDNDEESLDFDDSSFDTLEDDNNDEELDFDTIEDNNDTNTIEDKNTEELDFDINDWDEDNTEIENTNEDTYNNEDNEEDDLNFNDDFDDNVEDTVEIEQEKENDNSKDDNFEEDLDFWDSNIQDTTQDDTQDDIQDENNEDEDHLDFNEENTSEEQDTVENKESLNTTNVNEYNSEEDEDEWEIEFEWNTSYNYDNNENEYSENNEEDNESDNNQEEQDTYQQDDIEESNDYSDHEYKQEDTTQQEDFPSDEELQEQMKKDTFQQKLNNIWWWKIKWNKKLFIIIWLCILVIWWLWYTFKDKLMSIIQWDKKPNVEVVNKNTWEVIQTWDWDTKEEWNNTWEWEWNTDQKKEITEEDKVKINVQEKEIQETNVSVENVKLVKEKVENLFPFYEIWSNSKSTLEEYINTTFVKNEKVTWAMKKILSSSFKKMTAFKFWFKIKDLTAKDITRIMLLEWEKWKNAINIMKQIYTSTTWKKIPEKYNLPENEEKLVKILTKNLTTNQPFLDQTNAELKNAATKSNKYLLLLNDPKTKEYVSLKELFLKQRNIAEQVLSQEKIIFFDKFIDIWWRSDFNIEKDLAVTKALVEKIRENNELKKLVRLEEENPKELNKTLKENKKLFQQYNFLKQIEFYYFYLQAIKSDDKS